MRLRQKLLTVFGGLALLALVVTGVTLWVTFQWRDSNDKLQGHYQRSLQLQRVRATAFRAFKEVPDAVSGGDKKARQEFEELLVPAEQDFQIWAGLAHDDEERTQVRQVRAAYDELVRNARAVFDLVDAGRRDEALDTMEGQLEDHDFASFQQLTEEAVGSDRKYREVIRAQTEGSRRTAQLVLAIAAFGTLSLVLLLAAYLASDLFAPLREIEQGLDAVARGDMGRRLKEERADELGAVNLAFNRMVAAIAQREQMAALAAVPAGASETAANGSSWQNAPSRLTLHTLVSRLRARANQLDSGHADGGDDHDAAQQKRALLKQLDQLLRAVARITELGFPLDLNLASTEVRALLYEVLLRFHEELVKRAVSIEVEISPEVGHAVVDRLKLRVALGELVRNALAALPERGGRLEVSAALAAGGTELQIKVTDNGKGVERSLIDRAFAPKIGDGDQLCVGLALTKAIVEQHGGHLAITGEAGQGTRVRIRLPLGE